MQSEHRGEGRKERRKERKKRKEKKGKKRKEAKEGKEEGPTTGTRARVAWVRAAREPGRQGSQWAPPWREVTDRGKKREAVGKIEKRKAMEFRRATPPVELEPTIFGLEVRRLVH